MKKKDTKLERGISAQEIHEFLDAASSPAEKLCSSSTVVQFFLHAEPDFLSETMKFSNTVLWKTVLKAALNFFYCSVFYSTFLKDLKNTYLSSSSINMAVVLGVSERSVMLLGDVDLDADHQPNLSSQSDDVNTFLKHVARRRLPVDQGPGLFPFQQNFCLYTEDKKKYQQQLQI